MDARGSQNASPDDGPDKGPGESMSSSPVDVGVEGEAQGIHRNADFILAECETRYVLSQSSAQSQIPPTTLTAWRC